MTKAILLVVGAGLALAGCNDRAPGGSPPTDPVAVAGDAASPADPAPGAAPTAPSPTPSPATPPLPPAPASPPPAPPAITGEPPVGTPATTSQPPSGAAQKGPQGARVVLARWADAMQTHQFGSAWELFGNPPSSRDAFIKWWQRYRTIKVSVGKGVQDAGMGSLYYTTPVTLTGTTMTGKPFRLAGDVIVRRVNDVDGATPAQLRWHLGSADLKEVAP